MYICSARPDAVACIKGGPAAPCLTGEARFYQKSGGVLVTVNVSGLPEGDGTGFFALHIHEGGSCSGEGFADAGGHYNPAGAEHPKHAGDLPPLLRCKQSAYLSVLTDRFCVRDIIGRTVIIHGSADDFHSQPAGHAGTRIACGLICPSLSPAR